MTTATVTAIARQIATIAGIVSVVELAKNDDSGERWWMPSRKKVSVENNFGSIVGLWDWYSKTMIVELATDVDGDGNGNGNSTSNSNDYRNDIGGGISEKRRQWWAVVDAIAKEGKWWEQFRIDRRFVGLVLKIYSKYVPGPRIANFVA